MADAGQALKEAISRGCPSCVRVLFEERAAPDVRGVAGYRFLENAVEAGPSAVALVQGCAPTARI